MFFFLDVPFVSFITRLMFSVGIGMKNPDFRSQVLSAVAAAIVSLQFIFSRVRDASVGKKKETVSRFV